MTEKVFWEDPYKTHLDTRIASVSGEGVTLEKTIFYALSGGQESDAGTIGGFTVIEAKKHGKSILYVLPPEHGLIAGEKVAVEIDWERRYRLMRLHFAAEVILEIMSRKLTELVKIGAHIAADKARIDFAWPENVAPLLAAIQSEAREIIEADRPIISDYSDRVGERRYWQVAGFARVACGGTHLKRTAEVGAIALKRKNIGKGKERVEISLARV